MLAFNKYLLIFASLLLFNSLAQARTDFEARESYLRARSMNKEQEIDHSAHENHIDKSQDFHGVFYGYVPCDDCDGIKSTLSLNQKNNYSLVTQPARQSNKEYYEKGKYDWNEDTLILTLTPRGKNITRQYLIQSEGSIIQLDENGKRYNGWDSDRYILNRSDNANNREVHIH